MVPTINTYTQNLLTFGFAHPCAFDPSVVEFAVDFIAALPSPTASTTATTALAFLGGAAFGTFQVHRAGNQRCGCCCGHVHDTSRL